MSRHVTKQYPKTVQISKFYKKTNLVMKKLSMNVLFITTGIIFFSGCSKKENDKTDLLPPVADFEVSEAQINLWETVVFSDVSENNPDEWVWHFEGGDPEVSVERDPEVLYKEAGKFAVKLIVKNKKGESIKKMEDLIEVSEYEHNFETLTDVRDGEEYKTIQIGNVNIMAENLCYMNRDAVYYENKPSYGEEYGLLYKWETALDACPAGWRLPTRNEYEMIMQYLGGEQEAGGKLKKSGTEYWLSPNEFGTNESGFSAVGSGRYMPGHLEFFGMHETAYFWTQTEAADDRVWTMSLFRKNGSMVIHNTTSREVYYSSVRCIKD